VNTPFAAVFFGPHYTIARTHIHCGNGQVFFGDCLCRGGYITTAIPFCLEGLYSILFTGTFRPVSHRPVEAPVVVNRCVSAKWRCFVMLDVRGIVTAKIYAFPRASRMDPERELRRDLVDCIGTGIHRGHTGVRARTRTLYPVVEHGKARQGLRRSQGGTLLVQCSLGFMSIAPVL